MQRALNLESRAEVFLSRLYLCDFGQNLFLGPVGLQFFFFPLTQHNYRNTIMNTLENLQLSIHDFIHTNKQFQGIVLNSIPMPNL